MKKLGHLIIYLFCLGTSPTYLLAQESPQWTVSWDSLEQERLEKRGKLRAEKPIQDIVDDNINMYRLLMLGHEWWGIPTEKEDRRLRKAREARFMPYASPLGDTDWRSSNRVFYRNQDKLSADQNLTVLGWHPYWEGDAYKTYNFKLLTHIAYYGYEVNPFTGGYKDFNAIYDFQNNNLIPTAHLDTCKVLLTVSCRGSRSMNVFFTSEPEVQQNLIDSLRSILNRTGADGLDLNFEGVPEVHKNDFIQFVKELSFALREDDNRYTICMSIPLYDKDNIYDLSKLKPWIDFFIINGFNFHMQPTHLEEGPLSPLLSKDAPIRSTTFSYQVRTNLSELLEGDKEVSKITLLHNDDYEKKLRDSLNAYIRMVSRGLEYKDYDITDILNQIQLVRLSNGTPLRYVPNIQRLLERTNCVAELLKHTDAKVSANKTQFFLFEPESDVLPIKEMSLFTRIGDVRSEVDSSTLDLKTVIENYKERIGQEHLSSLVMGLPYHGAVWYKDGEGNRSFEGYIPYSNTLRLIESGRASVDYDKSTHSLIAMIRDTSLQGLYKIYFDNSTSLGRKYDFTIDEGLGGVGVWALGADHSHKELWATLEESFVSRRVWNEAAEMNQRVTVTKGNKVQYTIQYMLKHFSPLTFATLFFITIFICISFCFSVLDWKVRDVLFYSGAFRIFYLVLFTVIVLVLGNIFGWFKNAPLTFFIGTVLGLVLTWTASNLVEKRHKKLP